MKKIVFTGPESSGKTTICQLTAARFKMDWVAEYARDYLNNLNRPYKEADLLKIAKGQLARELAIRETKNSFLLCDTSLLVLKIWSEVKYGRCHPWIIGQLHQHLPTLYFLCYPDFPWEADDLREHPHQQNELLEIYKQEIKQLKVPVIYLKGTKEEREKEVLKILEVYSCTASVSP